MIFKQSTFEHPDNVQCREKRLVQKKDYLSLIDMKIEKILLKILQLRKSASL